MKKINLTLGLLILLTGVVVCMRVSWSFFSKIQFQHQLKQVTATVVGVEHDPMVPLELLKE